MRIPTTLTLAITVLLPFTACDLDALPSSERAALTADQDDARRDHRPPPLMLLELAIERGDLKDDATMTDALAAMQTAHADAMAARDELRVALADAIAADTVTADAFAAPLGAITQTASAEGTTLTEALDTAHGLLDAELRADVVEALPEPPPRPEAGQAPPSGDRPAGARPSGPPPQGDEMQPPPGDGPGGPMARLEALELDEDQQQALRDALGEPSRPPRPEPLDLALFAEDDFEAASLELAQLHAAHVTEQATRHIELLVALVPLLDEDQRTTLEGLLRDAPRGPTPGARG